MDKDKAREAAYQAWVHAAGNDIYEALYRAETSRKAAFGTGYDARDAKTCVWTQEENDSPRAACDPNVQFTDDIDEYGPFCQMCGGRIVTEAK